MNVASFVMAVLISVSKGGHLNEIRQVRTLIARVRQACCGAGETK